MKKMKKFFQSKAQVGPKSGVKIGKKSQKIAKIRKNLQKLAKIHHF
jgi:ribosomal protein S3